MIAYLKNEVNAIPKPVIVEKYDSMVDECLEGNVIIRVSLLTGDIESLDASKPVSKHDDDFFISLEMLDNLIDKAPKQAQVYMNTLVNDMLENYDGNDGISREKVAQLCRRIIILFYQTWLTYCILSAPVFLHNIQEKGLEQKDSMPYCICYFIAMDHGLMRMVSKTAGVLSSPKTDLETLTVRDLLTKTAIHSSISNGYDSKTDWKEQAKKEDEELSDLIYSTLRHIKNAGGKIVDYRSLDELLIKSGNDMEKLICEYMTENTEVVNMGCLFYILQHLGYLRECTFKTFCNAVWSFWKKHPKDITKAQHRYNMIRENEKALSEDYASMFTRHLSERKHDINYDNPYDTVQWKRTRAIVNRWLPRFKDIRK